MFNPKKSKNVKPVEVIEVEAALDEMLEEELHEAAVEVFEPAVVIEKPTKAVKKEVELLQVIDGQLGIYENRVVNVPEEARLTVVENLGEGELYVDNTSVQFTANYRVSPGEKKEYKGAKVVFISSASRPNFRVTFYK